MKKSVMNTGNVLQDHFQVGGFRYYGAMVTLTYRDRRAWKPQHIRDTLTHCRKYLARLRIPCHYAWVAELQHRGAVHYHVLFWLPVGRMLPKFDRRRWWVHGSTRIERARKAVGYLVKYASKGNGAPQFPKGLRLHGRGGLSPRQRQVVAWWNLPRYVREVFTTEGAIVRRALGGGWIDLETGEWLEPWRPPDPGGVSLA